MWVFCRLKLDTELWGSTFYLDDALERGME
jgi:hypothetical protein